ncbi:hypothetical protein ALT785_650006 [Alteromonas infernus]
MNAKASYESKTTGPEESSSLLSIAKKPTPLSVEPSQPERSTEALAVVLEIENARAALASRDSLKREGLLTGTSL